MKRMYRKVGRNARLRARGGSASQQLLTVGEVARLLNLHPNTVRKWSNDGLIKVYRIGSRRDRRFRTEDVLQFLSGDGSKPTDDRSLKTSRTGN